MGIAARPPGSGRAERSMPVGLRAVMRERAIAERAAVAFREGLDRVRRSVLQLLRRERDGVAAAVRVVVELAPGHGVVLLADPEHASEADDREQDVVGGLLEHDVLDLADLLSREVVDVRSYCLGGTNCSGVARSSWHDLHLLVETPASHARNMPMRAQRPRVRYLRLTENEICNEFPSKVDSLENSSKYLKPSVTPRSGIATTDPTPSEFTR